MAIPGLIGDPAVNSRYTREGVRIDPAMLEDTPAEQKGAFEVTIDKGLITFVRS